MSAVEVSAGKVQNVLYEGQVPGVRYTLVGNTFVQKDIHVAQVELDDLLQQKANLLLKIKRGQYPNSRDQVLAEMDQRIELARQALAAAQAKYGDIPALTAKPPPSSPVIRPDTMTSSNEVTASATKAGATDTIRTQVVFKSQLILARRDGSRIITGNNTVQQGDTIFLNMIGSPPNISLEVRAGSFRTHINTSASGTAQATLVMNEPGNITVNVIDRTRSHTDAVTVWVQPKPTPQQPQPPQSAAPSEGYKLINGIAPSQQQQQTAGPSFVDQLGQVGEQAKVGFGGFGVGVVVALGLAAVFLLKKPRL